MSFRKRPPISHGDTPIIVDVATAPSGARCLISISSSEFFDKHPIPMEEFTLSQELEAGVSLKEIPCGSLIGSTDPLDHDIDESKLLASLTPPAPPTE